MSAIEWLSELKCWDTVESGSSLRASWRWTYFSTLTPLNAKLQKNVPFLNLELLSLLNSTNNFHISCSVLLHTFLPLFFFSFCLAPFLAFGPFYLPFCFQCHRSYLIYYSPCYQVHSTSHSFPLSVDVLLITHLSFDITPQIHLFMLTSLVILLPDEVQIVVNFLNLSTKSKF